MSTTCSVPVQTRLCPTKMASNCADNQSRFLMNASGTGKTRLLLEGLCQNWGIYTTAGRDAQRIGSTVTEIAIRDMDEERALVTSSPPLSCLGANAVQLHNSAIIKRRCESVLLAHMLIFREYLRVLKTLPDLGSINVKQQWLKYHTVSGAIRGIDCVQRVRSRLLGLSVQDTESLVAECRADLKLLCSGPIFVCLDEANIPARMLPTTFRDGQEDSAPLLHYMIRTWKEMLGDAGTIVVAGTDIPRQCFSSKAWASWRWSSNTGAFTTRELQEQYLSRVVPPSLYHSETGSLLRERLWQWCRYRYIGFPP
jgi:hypothetical protein